MMNPYRVLGIKPGADYATIQAAYRLLIREHHPDRLAPDGDAFRASEINAAFALLKDPGRRAKFDAEFFGASAKPQPAQNYRNFYPIAQRRGPSLKDRQNRLRQVRVFRLSLLLGALILVGLGIAGTLLNYESINEPLWRASKTQPESVSPASDPAIADRLK